MDVVRRISLLARLYAVGVDTAMRHRRLRRQNRLVHRLLLQNLLLVRRRALYRQVNVRSVVKVPKSIKKYQKVLQY